MTPFDFLNSISYTKEDLIKNESDEKEYNPWMINRGLSHFPDTVLHANQMNMNYHLPNRAQYRYLLNSISKKKRFSKWPKAEKNEDIEMISEYYQINVLRAKEIDKLLSKEQKDVIRSHMVKGGRE